MNLGSVDFADGVSGRPLVDNIQLVPVGSLSSGMQQSALMPGQPDAIYFGKAGGLVEQYSFNPDGTLNDDFGFLMDVAAAVNSLRSGAFGGNAVSLSNGLRGIAFHPDFNTLGADGYGKFYTMHTEALGGPNPDYTLTDLAVLLGIQDGDPDNFLDGLGQSDCVLHEWTFDPQGVGVGLGNSQIQSSRQVFRIQYPYGHHLGQNIGFNPTAKPGDPDYGNLYVTFGDTGGFGFSSGLPGQADVDDFSADPVITQAPQDGGTVIGKIIRINPLEDGSDAYTIPADNPHVGDSSTLDEIYARGFRNPQTLSFDTETGKLLIGEIGQRNVEEINLIEAGKNYGWSDREGTFDFATDFDSTTLTQVPMASRLTDPYTYPVAQFDHQGPAGEAIVGGFVYHGEKASELDGWYLFSDLAGDEVYIARADDLVNDEQPAVIYQLPLEKANGTSTDLGTELGLGSTSRANVRFAQDVNGEVYIVSKTTGTIFRLEGTSQPAPAYVGAHLAYRASAFDATSNIAPDKQPLVDGETAAFDNYSSYTRGINRVVVDLQSLRNDGADLSADDFIFRVGNDNMPGAWPLAADAPISITVLPGEGDGGSDRVLIDWADNAIQNTWLQVTVLSNDNTALPVDMDIMATDADDNPVDAGAQFYYGNARCETNTGNAAGTADVNITDAVAAFNNRTLVGEAPIDNDYDFNRDGTVNITDAVAAFNSRTISSTVVNLITPPGAAAWLPLKDSTAMVTKHRFEPAQ